MSISEPLANSEVHEMTCMEILGGISATERAVRCPGLDLWVSSRPYQDEATGGDVHYVSLCGGGVITRVMLGDVSGHGEHVREYAEELRRLIKRHIVRKSQSRFMRDLNRSFAEYARLNRFATAVVMTYLSHRRSIEMCIAGHPRPLLYRKSTSRWSFLGEGLASDTQPTQGVSNMPIGVDETAGFETFRLTLEPGDVMILYTDALTEARAVDNRLLGESGLMGILAKIDMDTTSFETIGPRLLEQVAAYRGEQPRDDDETLMVLHHNGGGPKSAGLSERIEAVVKMLRIKDF